jgi:tetratricopeptide (TPR) repeat protein
MTTVPARAALCACILQSALWAQAAPAPGFEDLARQAAAVLDSRPAEAAGLYRQALALRPEWAEGWMYMGAALYQSGRYAEATDAFRRGIDLAPNLGTAWAFLGLCEAELDNADQALADIRKGEALGLGNNAQFEMAVRVKAAQVLIQASAFNEALEQLQVLALRGINAPALEATMGLATMGVPSAFGELTPQQRAVVALVGKAAWASGSQRAAEAAAAYKELMQQYPDEPGVRYAHGLYLMETDLTGALAEFEKEVQKNPKHWPALLAIASLQIRKGAPEAAIPPLREALKLVPTNQRWQCHAELGRAALAMDKLGEALNQLETAVHFMPAIPQLHFYLSQAYRRLGREQDAQKETAEFQRLKSLQDPLGVPAKD